MKSSILIVTALWGRADLTRLVMRYYQDMVCDNPEYEISLLCVGSEGEESKNMAHLYGWSYVEAPNVPLSQKFNKLFQAAEQHEPDLVVLVGSDDLISFSLIKFYADHIDYKHPNVVGLKDLYFYSIHKDQMIHFPGYPLPSPRTIGAGRCFSRRILDTMDWRPWQDEILNRGLDSASTARMKKRGIMEEAHSMADLGGFGLDIKDQMVNLTAWERVEQISTPVQTYSMERHFAESFGDIQILDRLRALRKDFIFVPDQNYWVEVISPSHPAYGQKLEVSGEVAIQLVIKKVIAHP